MRWQWAEWKRAGAIAATLLLSISAKASHAADAPKYALSMDDAVALAQTRDSDVDRARRSNLIAELQVKNARSQYLPTASLSVNASQSANGSTIRSDGFAYGTGIQGSFVGTLTANVDVPIDVSGAIGRQVKAARMRLDGAEEALTSASVNALIDVQLAYLEAMRTQRQLDIDRLVIGSIRSLIADSRKRVPSMVPYLEVELANASQLVAASVNQREAAFDRLRLELRLPLESELELTSDIPADVDTLALPNDIDPDGTQRVSSARRQADLAELAVEQSRDARRPSLGVGAYATQTFSGQFIDSAGNSSNRNYGLSLRLNLPILNYDAGRSGNSRRVTELLAEQAREDVVTTKLQWEVQFRQAKGTLERARQQLANLPDDNAASAALSAAIKAYIAAPPAQAPALLPQISNARSAWRNAQLAGTRARIEVASAWLAAARLAWTPKGSVNVRLNQAGTMQ